MSQPGFAADATLEDTGTASADARQEPDSGLTFLRAARAGNLEKIADIQGTVDVNYQNVNGLCALHLAAREGHLAVVLKLIDRGANVDLATKKGNTPLHVAALAGRFDVVRALVEHGCNVNAQTEAGFTAVYMAAQENHEDIVRYLLERGADSQKASQEGYTPLAVAVREGSDRAVCALLEFGQAGRVKLPALHAAAKKDDVDAVAVLLRTQSAVTESSGGFTPLHIASHYGKIRVAKLLLDHDADVNFKAKNAITPLHVAARWGQCDIITLLVNHGADLAARTADGLTPVHCAARNGHQLAADCLLELCGGRTGGAAAMTAAKTKSGLTALHMTAQGDHTDCARLLIHHGALVDDISKDRLTALHISAHYGHFTTAKLLLDRKCDPDARAINGFTPLHIACKKHRVKVVQLLLKYGASIDAVTVSGLSPLHIASFVGAVDVVQTLLRHHGDETMQMKTVRGETPLHLAAKADQHGATALLLQNGADVNAKGKDQQTALHIAARQGSDELAQVLLQCGAEPNAATTEGFTPLHIAAKEGHRQVAARLLDHGARADMTTEKGMTALHIAAKYGQPAVARLLLEHGADINSSGNNGLSPLHVATHYGSSEVEILLLDSGASPHATAKNGYTPLHIAARAGRTLSAAALLDHGAKPSAASKSGFYPVHMASREGHIDVIRVLFERGASVNSPSNNGIRPLHLCAQEDKSEVAGTLLRCGADVNPRTAAGYTPLHTACHFGHVEIARFLIANGALMDEQTSLGYTPLHQAAQQGHILVVEMLLQNGASPSAKTNAGLTALDIARRLGHVSVAQVLIRATGAGAVCSAVGDTDKEYSIESPEKMDDGVFDESDDDNEGTESLSPDPYSYLASENLFGLSAYGSSTQEDLSELASPLTERAPEREIRFAGAASQSDVAPASLSGVSDIKELLIVSRDKEDDADRTKLSNVECIASEATVSHSRTEAQVTAEDYSEPSAAADDIAEVGTDELKEMTCRRGKTSAAVQLLTGEDMRTVAVDGQPAPGRLLVLDPWGRPIRRRADEDSGGGILTVPLGTWLAAAADPKGKATNAAGQPVVDSSGKAVMLNGPNTVEVLATPNMTALLDAQGRPVLVPSGSALAACGTHGCLRSRVDARPVADTASGRPAVVPLGCWLLPLGEQGSLESVSTAAAAAAADAIVTTAATTGISTEAATASVTKECLENAVDCMNNSLRERPLMVLLPNGSLAYGCSRGSSGCCVGTYLRFGSGSRIVQPSKDGRLRDGSGKKLVDSTGKSLKLGKKALCDADEDVVVVVTNKNEIIRDRCGEGWLLLPHGSVLVRVDEKTGRIVHEDSSTPVLGPGGTHVNFLPDRLALVLDEAGTPVLDSAGGPLVVPLDSDIVEPGRMEHVLRPDGQPVYDHEGAPLFLDAGSALLPSHGDGTVRPQPRGGGRIRTAEGKLVKLAPGRALAVGPDDKPYVDWLGSPLTVPLGSVLVPEGKPHVLLRHGHVVADHRGRAVCFESPVELVEPGKLTEVIAARAGTRVANHVERSLSQLPAAGQEAARAIAVDVSSGLPHLDFAGHPVDAQLTDQLAICGRTGLTPVESAITNVQVGTIASSNHETVQSQADDKAASHITATECEATEKPSTNSDDVLRRLDGSEEVLCQVSLPTLALLSASEGSLAANRRGMSNGMDTPDVARISHERNWQSIAAPDNVSQPATSVAQAPSSDSFLVSFMVDARGGIMRGYRREGMRFIIPPRCVDCPTRINCRLVRQGKLAAHGLLPPKLNSFSGQQLASRVIQLSPAEHKFLSPVLLEIPHCAALRGGEREICTMRSPDGQHWSGHLQSETANEHNARERRLSRTIYGIEPVEQLSEKKVVRLLLPDLPYCLALITRLRSDTKTIGSEGGSIVSSVVPQLRVSVPAGAVNRDTLVSLKVLPVSKSVIARYAPASTIGVGPMITVGPFLRRFREPLSITMPLPLPANYASASADSEANATPTGHLDPQEAQSLRLLCNISDNEDSISFDDITNSTPLKIENECVTFTTTLSARFWIVSCNPDTAHGLESTAADLFRRLSPAPFMAHFVVFARRQDQAVVSLRVLCTTDDRLGSDVLETQESYQEVARSLEVEVLDGMTIYAGLVGNLRLSSRGNQEPFFRFSPFQENRMSLQAELLEALPSAPAISAGMSHASRPADDFIRSSASRPADDFIRSSTAPDGAIIFLSEGAGLAREQQTLCCLSLKVPEFTHTFGSRWSLHKRYEAGNPDRPSDFINGVERVSDETIVPQRIHRTIPPTRQLPNFGADKQAACEWLGRELSQLLSRSSPPANRYGTARDALSTNDPEFRVDVASDDEVIISRQLVEEETIVPCVKHRTALSFSLPACDREAPKELLIQTGHFDARPSPTDPPPISGQGLSGGAQARPRLTAAAAVEAAGTPGDAATRRPDGTNGNSSRPVEEPIGVNAAKEEDRGDVTRDSCHLEEILAPQCAATTAAVTAPAVHENRNVESERLGYAKERLPKSQESFSEGDVCCLNLEEVVPGVDSLSLVVSRQADHCSLEDVFGKVFNVPSAGADVAASGVAAVARVAHMREAPIRLGSEYRSSVKNLIQETHFGCDDTITEHYAAKACDQGWLTTDLPIPATMEAGHATCKPDSALPVSPSCRVTPGRVYLSGPPLSKSADVSCPDATTEEHESIISSHEGNNAPVADEERPCTAACSGVELTAASDESTPMQCWNKIVEIDEEPSSSCNLQNAASPGGGDLRAVGSCFIAEISASSITPMYTRLVDLEEPILPTLEYSVDQEPATNATLNALSTPNISASDPEVCMSCEKSKVDLQAELEAVVHATSMQLFAKVGPSEVNSQDATLVAGFAEPSPPLSVCFLMENSQAPDFSVGSMSEKQDSELPSNASLGMTDEIAVSFQQHAYDSFIILSKTAKLAPESESPFMQGIEEPEQSLEEGSPALQEDTVVYKVQPVAGSDLVSPSILPPTAGASATCRRHEDPSDVPLSEVPLSFSLQEPAESSLTSGDATCDFTQPVEAAVSTAIVGNLQSSFQMIPSLLPEASSITVIQPQTQLDSSTCLLESVVTVIAQTMVAKQTESPGFGEFYKPVVATDVELSPLTHGGVLSESVAVESMGTSPVTGKVAQLNASAKKRSPADIKQGQESCVGDSCVGPQQGDVCPSVDADVSSVYVDPQQSEIYLSAAADVSAADVEPQQSEVYPSADTEIPVANVELQQSKVHFPADVAVPAANVEPHQSEAIPSADADVSMAAAKMQLSELCHSADAGVTIVDVKPQKSVMCPSFDAVVPASDGGPHRSEVHPVAGAILSVADVELHQSDMSANGDVTKAELELQQSEVCQLTEELMPVADVRPKQSQVWLSGDAVLSVTDLKPQESEMRQSTDSNVTTADVELRQSDVHQSADLDVSAADDGQQQIEHCSLTDTDVPVACVELLRSEVLLPTDNAVSVADVTPQQSEVYQSADADVSVADLEPLQNGVCLSVAPSVIIAEVEPQKNKVYPSADEAVSVADAMLQQSEVLPPADEAVSVADVKSFQSEVRPSADADASMADVEPLQNESVSSTELSVPVSELELHKNKVYPSADRAASVADAMPQQSGVPLPTCEAASVADVKLQQSEVRPYSDANVSVADLEPLQNEVCTSAEPSVTTAEVEPQENNIYSSADEPVSVADAMLQQSEVLPRADEVVSVADVKPQQSEVCPSADDVSVPDLERLQNESVPSTEPSVTVAEVEPQKSIVYLSADESVYAADTMPKQSKVIPPADEAMSVADVKPQPIAVCPSADEDVSVVNAKLLQNELASSTEPSVTVAEVELQENKVYPSADEALSVAVALPQQSEVLPPTDEAASVADVKPQQSEVSPSADEDVAVAEVESQQSIACSSTEPSVTIAEVQPQNNKVHSSAYETVPVADTTPQKIEVLLPADEAVSVADVRPQQSEVCPLSDADLSVADVTPQQNEVCSSSNADLFVADSEPLQNEICLSTEASVTIAEVEPQKNMEYSSADHTVSVADVMPQQSKALHLADETMSVVEVKPQQIEVCPSADADVSVADVELQQREVCQSADVNVTVAEVEPQKKNVYPSVGETMSVADAMPQESEVLPRADEPVCVADVTTRQSEVCPSADADVSVADLEPLHNESVPSTEPSVTTAEVDPQNNKVHPSADEAVFVVAAMPLQSEVHHSADADVSVADVEPQRSEVYPSADADVSVAVLEAQQNEIGWAENAVVFADDFERQQSEVCRSADLSMITADVKLQQSKALLPADEAVSVADAKPQQSEVLQPANEAVTVADVKPQQSDLCLSANANASVADMGPYQNDVSPSADADMSAAHLEVQQREVCSSAYAVMSVADVEPQQNNAHPSADDAVSRAGLNLQQSEVRPSADADVFLADLEPLQNEVCSSAETFVSMADVELQLIEVCQSADPNVTIADVEPEQKKVHPLANEVVSASDAKPQQREVLPTADEAVSVADRKPEQSAVCQSAEPNVTIAEVESPKNKVHPSADEILSVANATPQQSEVLLPTDEAVPVADMKLLQSEARQLADADVSVTDVGPQQSEVCPWKDTDVWVANVDQQHREVLLPADGAVSDADVKQQLGEMFLSTDAGVTTANAQLQQSEVYSLSDEAVSVADVELQPNEIFESADSDVIITDVELQKSEVQPPADETESFADVTPQQSQERSSTEVDVSVSDMGRRQSGVCSSADADVSVADVELQLIEVCQSADPNVTIADVKPEQNKVHSLADEVVSASDANPQQSEVLPTADEAVSVADLKPEQSAVCQSADPNVTLADVELQKDKVRPSADETVSVANATRQQSEVLLPADEIVSVAGVKQQQSQVCPSKDVNVSAADDGQQQSEICLSTNLSEMCPSTDTDVPVANVELQPSETLLPADEAVPVADVKPQQSEVCSSADPDMTKADVELLYREVEPSADAPVSVADASCGTTIKMIPQLIIQVDAPSHGDSIPMNFLPKVITTAATFNSRPEDLVTAETFQVQSVRTDEQLLTPDSNIKLYCATFHGRSSDQEPAAVGTKEASESADDEFNGVIHVGREMQLGDPSVKNSSGSDLFQLSCDKVQQLPKASINRCADDDDPAAELRQPQAIDESGKPASANTIDEAELFQEHPTKILSELAAPEGRDTTTTVENAATSSSIANGEELAGPSNSEAPKLSDPSSPADEGAIAPSIGDQISVDHSDAVAIDIQLHAAEHDEASPTVADVKTPVKTMSISGTLAGLDRTGAVAVPINGTREDVELEHDSVDGNCDGAATLDASHCSAADPSSVDLPDLLKPLRNEDAKLDSDVVDTASAGPRPAAYNSDVSAFLKLTSDMAVMSPLLLNESDSFSIEPEQISPSTVLNTSLQSSQPILSEKYYSQPIERLAQMESSDGRVSYTDGCNAVYEGAGSEIAGEPVTCTADQMTELHLHRDKNSQPDHATQYSPQESKPDPSNVTILAAHCSAGFSVNDSAHRLDGSLHETLAETFDKSAAESVLPRASPAWCEKDRMLSGCEAMHYDKDHSVVQVDVALSSSACELGYPSEVQYNKKDAPCSSLTLGACKESPVLTDAISSAHHPDGDVMNYEGIKKLANSFSLLETESNNLSSRESDVLFQRNGAGEHLEATQNCRSGSLLNSMETALSNSTSIETSQCDGHQLVDIPLHDDKPPEDQQKDERDTASTADSATPFAVTSVDPTDGALLPEAEQEIEAVAGLSMQQASISSDVLPVLALSSTISLGTDGVTCKEENFQEIPTELASPLKTEANQSTGDCASLADVADDLLAPVTVAGASLYNELTSAATVDAPSDTACNLSDSELSSVWAVAHAIVDTACNDARTLLNKVIGADYSRTCDVAAVGESAIFTEGPATEIERSTSTGAEDQSQGEWGNMCEAQSGAAESANNALLSSAARGTHTTRISLIARDDSTLVDSSNIADVNQREPVLQLLSHVQADDVKGNEKSQTVLLRGEEMVSSLLANVHRNESSFTPADTDNSLSKSPCSDSPVVAVNVLKNVQSENGISNKELQGEEIESSKSTGDMSHKLAEEIGLETSVRDLGDACASSLVVETGILGSCASSSQNINIVNPTDVLTISNLQISESLNEQVTTFGACESCITLSRVPLSSNLVSVSTLVCSCPHVSTSCPHTASDLKKDILDDMNSGGVVPTSGEIEDVPPPALSADGTAAIAFEDNELTKRNLPPEYSDLTYAREDQSLVQHFPRSAEVRCITTLDNVKDSETVVSAAKLSVNAEDVSSTGAITICRTLASVEGDGCSSHEFIQSSPVFLEDVSAMPVVKQEAHMNKEECRESKWYPQQADNFDEVLESAHLIALKLHGHDTCTGNDIVAGRDALLTGDLPGDEDALLKHGNGIKSLELNVAAPLSSAESAQRKELSLDVVEEANESPCVSRLLSDNTGDLEKEPVNGLPSCGELTGEAPRAEDSVSDDPDLSKLCENSVQSGKPSCGPVVAITTLAAAVGAAAVVMTVSDEPADQTAGEASDGLTAPQHIACRPTCFGSQQIHDLATDSVSCTVEADLSMDANSRVAFETAAGTEEQSATVGARRLADEATAARASQLAAVSYPEPATQQTVSAARASSQSTSVDLASHCGQRDPVDLLLQELSSSDGSIARHPRLSPGAGLCAAMTAGGAAAATEGGSSSILEQVSGPYFATDNHVTASCEPALSLSVDINGNLLELDVRLQHETPCISSEVEGYVMRELDTGEDCASKPRPAAASVENRSPVVSDSRLDCESFHRKEEFDGSSSSDSSAVENATGEAAATLIAERLDRPITERSAARSCEAGAQLADCPPAECPAESLPNADSYSSSAQPLSNIRNYMSIAVLCWTSSSDDDDANGDELVDGCTGLIVDDDGHAHFASGNHMIDSRQLLATRAGARSDCDGVAANSHVRADRDCVGNVELSSLLRSSEPAPVLHHGSSDGSNNLTADDATSTVVNHAEAENGVMAKFPRDSQQQTTSPCDIVRAASQQSPTPAEEADALSLKDGHEPARTSEEEVQGNEVPPALEEHSSLSQTLLQATASGRVAEEDEHQARLWETALLESSACTATAQADENRDEESDEGGAGEIDYEEIRPDGSLVHRRVTVTVALGPDANGGNFDAGPQSSGQQKEQQQQQQQQQQQHSGHGDVGIAEAALKQHSEDHVNVPTGSEKCFNFDQEGTSSPDEEDRSLLEHSSEGTPAFGSSTFSTASRDRLEDAIRAAAAASGTCWHYAPSLYLIRQLSAVEELSETDSLDRYDGCGESGDRSRQSFTRASTLDDARTGDEGLGGSVAAALEASPRPAAALAAAFAESVDSRRRDYDSNNCRSCGALLSAAGIGDFPVVAAGARRYSTCCCSIVDWADNGGSGSNTDRDLRQDVIVTHDTSERELKLEEEEEEEKKKEDTDEIFVKRRLEKGGEKEQAREHEPFAILSAVPRRGGSNLSPPQSSSSTVHRANAATEESSLRSCDSDELSSSLHEFEELERVAELMAAAAAGADDWASACAFNDGSPVTALSPGVISSASDSAKAE